VAIPQDWMPPGMPDEQKDEIAAKHPDDPAAAAAEAWAVWANEMPVDEQGVKSVTTGAQSITYDQSPYESAMERARWYKSRSKSAASVDVGGTYRFGWNAPTRYTGSSEAADGDPALPNGEPWGAWTVTTADVVLTNGSGPLNRSNIQTQEAANQVIVNEIAGKADVDHVHADDGSAVDLSDYETKTEAAVAHNSLHQDIQVGLASKSDKDHVHETDLSGFVTKEEANAAHQALDQKIDAAAAGDHTHADYETKAEAQTAHDSLSGRITQVSQDKADTGHGHIDLETKIAAQESHQDLQDQIDDRALVSHTHPDATPDLSDYETKVASEARDASLENQIKQKADSTHTHPEVQPPDLTNYVTKTELSTDQARQDQALTEGLAEKSEYNHVHDGSNGGAKYELEADAVQRYERTSLELSTKADKDHDHGATDHDHDDYATSVELQTETALRKQGDADLQSQINSAVAGGHDHDNDYASKSHAHGNYADSNHSHPEYEGGGGSSDVTKAYVDAQDATEKQERIAGDAAEKQERIAGDDAVKVLLEQESHDREAADLAMQYQHATEIDDRKAADQNLQDQIDTIQSAGYDDTQIKADLAQEIADREAGDTALNERIDALEPYDDSQLKMYLSQEVIDRKVADAELQAQIESLPHLDLDLQGEVANVTGVENFVSMGTLRYKLGEYVLGRDVLVYEAQFLPNPSAIGLNHDLVGGGRVKWIDEFPVGSVMLIQGPDGTLAYQVTKSQAAGSNNRGQGFEGNVLFESGTFTNSQELQVGRADLVGDGQRLLLNGVVVGDSAWEGRITTLENDEGYDDAELREQVDKNTAALANLGGGDEAPSLPDGSPVIKTITITGLLQTNTEADNTFFPKDGSGMTAPPYTTSKITITTTSDDPYDLDARNGSMIAQSIGHLLIVNDAGHCILAWKIGVWRSQGPGKVEITVGQPLHGDGGWMTTGTRYNIVLKDV